MPEEVYHYNYKNKKVLVLKSDGKISRFLQVELHFTSILFEIYFLLYDMVLLFFSGASKADLRCFERFNPTGNFNGHCGRNNKTGSYAKCLPE